MAERLEAQERPPVLDSVRVLDWTDQVGAYAGRLLADLGADVVRIEPADDRGWWPEEPVPAEAGAPAVSALERYVNLNKRSIRVNPATSRGQDLLGRLINHAGIVLTSGDAPRRWHQAGRPLRPPGCGVHVSVSPFGDFGVGTGLLADDLVTLAAGGLLSLGGYPDGEPVAVYGSQAWLAGGINAAVAALLGVLAADSGEPGADLDVSVQAVLASALEDATAEYDLTGQVRRRVGDWQREAGTGTYVCYDGWIAVVAGKLGTAEAWDSLVGWLCDQDVPGAEALKAPEWSSLEHRRLPQSISTFHQLMETATARMTRQELYAELQRRRIAVAPINSVADLLADPQLSERAFFRRVHDPVLDREVTYPGPPYRLEDHAVPDWTGAPAPGSHTEQVLRDWLEVGDDQIAALRDDGAIG